MARQTPQSVGMHCRRTNPHPVRERWRLFANRESVEERMTSAALIEDQHVAFAVEMADVARTVLRENDMARVDVSAVSYTHLDVYKRQISGCLEIVPAFL